MSTAGKDTTRLGAVAFLIAILGTLISPHPPAANAASTTPDLTPICGATAISAPYSDVTAADVHKPHIDCAVSLDLITAQSNTRFGSASTITRGEAALAIIALINYTPMTLTQTPTLSNSATQRAQAEALATLAQNNIMARDSRLQDAQAAITRGEFADMLFTTQQRLGIPFPTATAAQFDDINRTDVNTLAVASIAVGRTPNAFAPTLSLRRGQAATMITRAALHLEREDLWQTQTQTGTPAPAPAPAPPAPPTLGLTYATSTFSRGQTNETLTPTVSNGTAASFSFSGNLPPGVTANSNTGEITGPAGWATAGISTVSAGDSFTCALLTDKTVWCWGNNGGVFGRLGDGTEAQTRTTPVQVLAPGGVAGQGPYLTDVTQISARNAFTCAVLQSTEVVCWGEGNSGRRGDGTTARTTIPKYVLTSGTDQSTNRLTGVAQVDTGSAHACARLIDGTVRCWGSNDKGQLGNNSTIQSLHAIAPTGTAPTTVTDIAVGRNHSCALLANGEVRCWGYNNTGQIGDGTETDRRTPVAVLSSGTAVNNPVNFEGAVSISTNHEHTCAVMNDATARCWGYGRSGELGDGFKLNRSHPVTVLASGTTDVDPVTLTGVTAIEAGTIFTCALLTDATVRCFGDNTDGALGDGTTDGVGGTNDRPNPVAVLASGSDQTATGTFLSGATGITVDFAHACAYNDQSAYCWGRGSNGELGNGATTPKANPNPVNVTIGDPGWPATITITVTDTDGNTAATTVTLTSTQPPLELTYATSTFTRGQSNETLTPTVSNGTAASFSISGNLPPGVTVNSNTGALTGPASWNAGITMVSAGDTFSCALLADTTVWCWGDNADGQLGDGTTTNRTNPVQVLAPNTVAGQGQYLTGITHISAGNGFACAVAGAVADDEVVCWGSGDSGRRGDGTTQNSSVPKYVLISGTDQSTNRLPNVTKVAAGGGHACARLSDGNGALRCWGSNSAGQLGNSSTTNSLHATPPTGTFPIVTDIAVGASHSCALLYSTRVDADLDGVVRCWGNNANGQLGDGTIADRTFPANVLASGTLANADSVRFDGARAISAHTDHTCVRMKNNTARCWGLGTNGQLGDGVASPTHVAKYPVAVLASGTANTNPVSLADISEIQVGSASTCARLTNTTVRCFGANTNGKLGDGTTTTQSNPVAVLTTGSDQAAIGTFLSGVMGITVGTDHACAYSDQGAYCWGNGSSFRLGNGADDATNANPVTVAIGNPGWPATVNITVTDTRGRTASTIVKLRSIAAQQLLIPPPAV